MKRALALLAVLWLPVCLHAQQSSTTPNIGLKIPFYGTQDWQIPLSYDLNQLDLFLSGNLPLPGLDVNGNLLVTGTLTAPGFTPSFANIIAGLGYTPAADPGSNGVVFRTGVGTSTAFSLPWGVTQGGTGLTSLPPSTGQTNYLRSAPNVATPALQYAPTRVLEVPDYNFPAITPGGTITAAVVATVTLPYTPLGVAGTDTAHYLRITGGTGAAESVLIIGGTCIVGGSGPCTIQFTPANTHSGAWTVVSATAGIQEAINQALNITGYAVHAPAGAYSLLAPVSINAAAQRTQTFYGDGTGYFNNIAGTVITNNATTPGFSLVGDLVNNGCEAQITLRNFTLHGSPTSGTGISASNACMLRIDHVFQTESQLYGLSCGPNCYTLEVTDSYFYSNGLDGALIASAVNEVHFDKDAFQGNCRQAVGLSCAGLTIDSSGQNALAVSVTKSGFALDGVLPIAGFPASSYEANFKDVKALTFSENYCEQPLTGCFHTTSTSRGITVSGNYMQQGGISIDAGAASIVLSGNHLTGGSVVQTITNVTNNGGFCQITISAPPTNGPYTVGAFVALTGIGGATACNDTPFDTAATVQSVASSTVFTTGRPFAGSYTSGGAARRAGGYSIGGSGGNSDAHIFGNSLDTSNGDLLTVGGDLLSGTGPDIIAASAIVINHTSHVIDGSTAIDNMIPPSGFAGQFCAIPSGTGTWSTTTAGNFGAVFTATPLVQKCWTYYTGTSKWY